MKNEKINVLRQGINGSLIKINSFLIILLLIITTMTYAKTPVPGQDTYISTVTNEFKELKKNLNEKERKNWEYKWDDISSNILSKIKEIKSFDNVLSSQPDYKKLQEIMPYSFFRDVGLVELQQKTKTTEELGNQLFFQKYNKELLPIINTIEKELTSLENNDGALTLQSKLTEYFTVKRQVERLKDNIPIKTRYEFRPQANVWDDSPQLVEAFVLHDWLFQILKT